MADTDQIKVVVRVRPVIVTEREQQTCQDACWVVKDEKLISQSDQPHLPPYFFDHVYDRGCSTWELYSGDISPIVDAAMNGYHGTVFAYGQSGSGKTYTMSGSKRTPGIISQAMNDIFDFIEKKPSHEFLMRASYMEIYNERIYDLLNKEDKHLKLQETPDHQIHVVGLEEQLVNSCEQALSVIQSGEAKRTYAETKQNDRSSRSHCIFRIIIESRKRNEVDAAVMVSHLNFVDLAGSEKAAENSGDRFREGCSINKSLFSLSNVISKLSDGVSNQFINYRDSKLTRILQNALGGNSKTVIVATINPTTIEESHSTLRFATRAKTIKNKPHVNEVLSEAAMLKQYRNEINRLQRLVKEMGVADIQSANEDLKKQLDDKQQLIKQLTQQIVVSSSLSSTNGGQKKKMRRETWCAPKVQRKSYFPTLPPVDCSQVTIREEVTFDLPPGECLDLPFSSISPSHNNDSNARAFLRKSEELVLSQSLLKGAGSEEESPRAFCSKEQAEEVERLEEVIRLMEVEHMEQVEKLQERVKQLEFEKAVEVDHQEEKESSLAWSQKEEIGQLKEQLAQGQYEHQLLLEENRLLQTRLWHAEEDVKRLSEETYHLVSKRFDISLQEWEALETAKSSLEAETKQLMANLQDKEKEICELQKALAGQEPYIARLEQQLEKYMGTGNGQLEGGSKCRSSILVAVKAENEDCSGTPTPKPEKVSPVETVDRATSTEDLSVSPGHSNAVVDMELYPQLCSKESPAPSLVPVPVTELVKESDGSRPESLGEATAREVTFSLSTSEQELEVITETCSRLEDVFVSHEAGGTGETECLEGDGTAMPETQEVTGTATTPKESSTKLATRLKRRSDGAAALPVDLNSEMSLRLREREQEIEQLNSENAQMLDLLNQANAEIVRYKEVMEAMEQADAERMEELSEVPKLRALLNRRDMEVQRLESLNERLKEELNQQMLNSSTSSLSSSFSEPRRKSSVLKEREAEVWKLKDQLVQQAKHLEDIQQAKLALEDIVVDLQNQPPHHTEDQGVASEESSSPLPSSSSLPPAGNQQDEDAEEEEKNPEEQQWEEEKKSEEQHWEEEKSEEQHQVVVTAEELEAVQRMLGDKDSLISHLKRQLQEKEQEMEEMFEGQMLIPSNMIQTHLQQAEQQKQQIEDLTEQLSAQAEELAKLKARDVLRKGGEGGQGDEISFQEQLIMDKLLLEEALQEKGQELTQAVEKNQELQLQLDERRCLVNELRQLHENTTDALLSTQKELVALKQKSDEDQQQQPEDKALSQPASAPAQAPVTEEPVPKEEQDSFEISFKTTSVEVAAPADAEAGQVQMLEDLQQREQQLLERQKEKEEQICSLREALHAEQTRAAAAASDKFTEPPLGAGPSAETMNASGPGCGLDSSEAGNTPGEAQQEQGGVFMEKEKCQEGKLQEAAAAMEEKTSLESRVKELLAVIEEKSSLVSELQRLLEESGLKAGTLTTQSVSCSEPTDSSPGSAAAESATSGESVREEDRAALQAKLADVERRLEQNVQQLEQTRAEKAALDARVQELEAKLEELAAAGETNGALQTTDLACEKETLQKQVEKLTNEVESLQSQLQQLKSSRDGQGVLQSSVEASDPMSLQMAAEIVAAQTLESSNEVQSLHSQVDQLTATYEQIVVEKTALEKQVQDLKAEGESLCKQIEETQAQLTVACRERDVLEAKVQELTSKVDELSSTVEQLQAEREELTGELTWQTKACEGLQSRIEDLETELGELVQDLEKAQKLQEGSEQCQRVVEETLEDFKVQNARLELDKQTLATERDEFELKEEAARKEQERLKLELKITSGQLEGRISALEMELQTALQRKEVLEAALADRESAQHMGELLHEKLSAELRESQAQVVAMKTSMSQLQSALQSQESRFTTLDNAKLRLAAERDQLAEVKTSLEEERAELKVKLLSAEEEIAALQRALDSKEKDVEAKTALEAEVAARREEAQHLQALVRELEQEVESSRSETSRLRCELGRYKAQCQQLTQRAEQQLQEATDASEQLRRAQEEAAERAASAKAECSRLQEELGCKLELIEQLQKELEAAKTAAHSSSDASSNMVPLIEVKKQKFVLKNKIRHLMQELENVKEVFKYQDSYIAELQGKLKKYENEEQEDKDEKIEMLKNNLKAKNLELVGLKVQQQEELNKLSKQLSHAEEMIAYKEQMIGKLKGEIRRFRSEEVSFCTPAVPKARAVVSEPVKTTMMDERVISSHSGIIDRYTVTLLEADKYKLQKELKKTQDRLKCRESELHWAKVALAKAKTGGSPVSSSSPSPTAAVAASAAPAKSKVGSLRETAGRSDRLSMPTLQTELGSMKAQAPRPSSSAGSIAGEPRSPLIQRLGTSVDGLAPDYDSVAKTTWQRSDGSHLPDFVSASGSSVDVKRERSVLPSAVDKENTPLGTDVLPADKTSAAAKQAGNTSAGGDSPLNIEPEFWKKPQRAPPSLYRPSSTRLLGKSAASGADQCKTQ